MKFTEFLKDKLVKKINEAAQPKKEIKHFEVGDVILLVNTKKLGLPMDAYDFLMTFKKFTVIKVNDKGKLDIGCYISKNELDGTGVKKVYMFVPSRFELEDKELAKSREMSNIKPIEVAEEGVDPDVD